MLKWCLGISLVALLGISALAGAQETTVPDALMDSTDTVARPAQPTQVRELTERRSAYAQHFLMSDGTYQAKISTKPLFYQDDQGSWQPIRTELTPSAELGFSYEATQNQAQVYMPSDTSSFFRVATGNESDRAWVDFRPVNLSGSIALDSDGSGATVSVPDSDVDFRYRVLVEGGLKEDVVLKSASAPNRFLFGLRMHNLKLSQDSETGQISFYSTDENASEDPIFVIPQPFAVDADGQRTTDISVSVDQSGELAILSYQLSAEWLSKAQYPVTIDPPISIQTSAGGVRILGQIVVTVKTIPAVPIMPLYIWDGEPGLTTQACLFKFHSTASHEVAASQ
jgi:hypothetical protein